MYIGIIFYFLFFADLISHLGHIKPHRGIFNTSNLEIVRPSGALGSEFDSQ